MKTKFLMLALAIASMIAVQSCSSRTDSVRNEVDEAKKVLPAEMWDSLTLSDINCSNDAVIFDIVTNRELKNDEWTHSEEDVHDFGIFIMSNFVKAYIYTASGESGEGDEEMFLKVYPIIKKAIDNNIPVTINLMDKSRFTKTIELTPTDLKTAMDNDL